MEEGEVASGVVAELVMACDANVNKLFEPYSFTKRWHKVIMTKPRGTSLSPFREYNTISLEFLNKNFFKIVGDIFQFAKTWQPLENEAWSDLKWIIPAEAFKEDSDWEDLLSEEEEVYEEPLEVEEVENLKSQLRNSSHNASGEEQGPKEGPKKEEEQDVQDMAIDENKAEVQVQFGTLPLVDYNVKINFPMVFEARGNQLQLYNEMFKMTQRHQCS